jgi:7-cyano-7-deazaguanine synthase in queuosine biosynthesis
MAKDLAIVLNSGSLASAVATALAHQRYRLVMLHSEVVPAPGRRLAYERQVQHFKPYREHAVDMPFLETTQTEAPGVELTDPRMTADIKPQLVDLLPLAATALRFATFYQASAVYMGLRVGGNADELARATEWGQVLNELIQIPCGQEGVEVQLPLLEMELWQVVDLAFNVSAPLEATWSCDRADATEPCGQCRGCRGREAAFVQSGKIDPIKPKK